MQFPWLDVRLKRRTLDSALRAWLLQRGGYGVPHPEEVREVSEELAAPWISKAQHGTAR